MAKPKVDQHFVDHWTPWMRYVINKATGIAWLVAHDNAAFYGGKMWSLVTKPIGLGMYEASFTERK